MIARYLVLQILWNINTSSNVDFAELMWEEFVQAIQTFLTGQGQSGQSTPLFHLAEDDLRLGNLKFVPKGKADKVFGMPIPNELISNNIKNAPYYNAYLEMLVDKPNKEPAHSEPEPEPEHQGEGEEFDMKRAIPMKAIRPLPIVEGKGKAIVTEEQATQSLISLHTPKRRSTTDQFIFQRPTPATEEASTDAETGAGSDKTNSGGDTKILQINEELGEDVEKQVDLKERTAELDQDHAGSDPASTYQALVENSLLEKTGDMRMFMNWYCQKVGKTELTQADFEGQAYEVVKAFYPDVVHLQFQMEECYKMLTDQIDWAYPEGNQGCGQALLISKMKAAHYHDFRFEQLVPKNMWIDNVCTYDISASYGISHWWFNRQKFYIDRYTADSSRKAVRTHMRILSVVGIKAYSRYGYDYLKEITLRIADYEEYTIAEKDFKNLYPSDFEDLNLLLLEGHLNHLYGSNKRMLSTAVNLWTRNLDAMGYEYKHDYTIIELPHTVVFPVSNNERKIIIFNEIYKFSDGTLTNILEALHYGVKEYKVNRFNPGMNTQFWTDKDVARKHPSDTYVFTMKMEILLEPTSNKLMVGDSDVHTLEDPTLILEILSRRFFVRLNLPDHRTVLTGSGGSSKDGDGDTSLQWSLFHNRMLILDRYI
ncbi:hypothetical protein Tco_0356325 [Tanacetum coccineum]